MEAGQSHLIVRDARHLMPTFSSGSDGISLDIEVNVDPVKKEGWNASVSLRLSTDPFSVSFPFNITCDADTAEKAGHMITGTIHSDMQEYLRERKLKQTELMTIRNMLTSTGTLSEIRGRLTASR